MDPNYTRTTGGYIPSNMHMLDPKKKNHHNLKQALKYVIKSRPNTTKTLV